ncbi:universal stress protein [Massilia sp. TS11]|uniref:universal stress protein n=1 Tax=Massilia sp. TS11 TaxID=2908003 RepID=UPI001EDB5C1E|nr:universal stress protein [Massilia sp. TS11]MCG2583983.1 universal stress protein [Massilia sp. TS11]
MSYKTIVVHIDHSKHVPRRVQLAAELARRFGAHLVGSAMSGISRFIYGSTMVDLNGALLTDHIAFLRQRSGDALTRFETEARAAGVDSIESRLLEDDDHGGMCLQARYADLLVLGQTDPDGDSDSWLDDLPQFVVLHSGRPVLLVPYAFEQKTFGETVLVAWDGSRSAARAVADALPLLRQARKVIVSIIGAEVGADAHGEEPGADIALYLARQGVQVEVQAEPATADVGNVLLSQAANIGADLLVMGCYGHTRMRELVLGGATRTLLASMTIPVIMSH